MTSKMTNLKDKVSRFGKRIKKLKPRKFHCYCVGAAKTGTTSIASSFSQVYRTKHEPETQKTNHLIIQYLEGEITKQDLQTNLIERDKRLKLEMESAHPLGYISGVLADTFPQALFLITVREPLSWLHSRLNFHHKVNPPQWEEYRNYFWVQRHQGFASPELPLEKYGLCSLDTYLSQYADHYRRVLSEIPEGRRMIVITSDINNKLPEIAKFLGANSNELVVSHSNRSDNKITPMDEIDNKFVKERIMYHCGDLISQFFPDKLTDYSE